MGFHVQPHYISQQPAFCDVATCHIHFSLKQHQEKKRDTDIYRHICFDGNCFLTQILHWGVPAVGLCTYLPPHIQKTTKFQTLEPFIFLGERVGRRMCLGLTGGAVSITEPVSDSSLCQTQFSRCLLNLSLDDGNRSSFDNMFLLCLNTQYNAQVKKPNRVFEGYIQLVWGQYDKLT
jgi:hypothetical protein